MGKNGGPRPGSGRPKGSLSAQTLERRAAEAKVLQKHALTAQRVLEEIALHSFSNVQDLFDEAGNLKPIHTLTRAQAAAISSFEVIKKNAEAGDGVTDVVHKVRVVDKLKTLELLAKHFALLTEKLDVKGEFTFGWKGTPPEGKP
jgi:hypothetical protein